MFSLIRRFLIFIQRIAVALERIADALERQSASMISALPPEGLSKEDAACFLGVDVAAVEHLIRTRKLAYVQYGAQRGRVIPVESLRQSMVEFRQATGKELLKVRCRA